MLLSNAGRTGRLEPFQRTHTLCRKLLQTVSCLNIEVRTACVDAAVSTVWLFYACNIQLCVCVCLNADIVCVASALSPGEEVLRLLQSCNSFDLEELRKQESQLPQEDSKWKCTFTTSVWYLEMSVCPCNDFGDSFIYIYSVSVEIRILHFIKYEFQGVFDFA